MTDTGKKTDAVVFKRQHPGKAPQDKMCRLPLSAKVMVTVVVGEEEEEFFAHRDLLMLESEFFRTKLSGGWIESNTNRVKLPDTNPDTFQVFYDWLYTDGVDTAMEDSTLHNVQAYLLGDMLLSDRFKNCVIDGMVRAQEIEGTVTVQAANWAFANTDQGSKLRAFIADDWATLMEDDERFDGLSEGLWHPDLARAVINAMILTRNDIQERLEIEAESTHHDGCDLDTRQLRGLADPCSHYHEHKVNEQCSCKAYRGF